MTEYERMQQAFDGAWTGIASQGFQRSKSTADPHMCAYRGAGGKKCAIGWLIPDECYDTSLEGLPGGAVVNRGVATPFPDGAVGTGMHAFIRRLQMAHDDGTTPARMRENLTYVAKQYDLTIPEEE